MKPVPSNSDPFFYFFEQWLTPALAQGGGGWKGVGREAGGDGEEDGHGHAGGQEVVDQGLGVGGEERPLSCSYFLTPIHSTSEVKLHVFRIST